MRTILIGLTICFLSINVGFAQQTIELKPKGIYAEINVATQNKMLELLLDSDTRMGAIDTIFHNIKHYNPPVLYLFAEALFVQGERQHGFEWYLFAQLSALYDANRCADSSSHQATILLEARFRPVFEKYIKRNKKAYQASIDKVIYLFNKLEQDYDHRWINLHGMGAILSSLEESKTMQKPLSLPEVTWPEIKSKTIEQFLKINKL